MNDLLQIPLGLADVRVLETRQARSGEWVITLESTLDHAVCRCCGREIHDAYGYDRPIRLRHLPILDQEVYLELRPRRFRCRYCDDHPTTTQRLDWYEPNRPYTRAFERLVLRELINTTLSDVARKQGLSAEAVQGILEHAVAATVDWTQFTELPTLGIDEIALKKGHRDFVVIVTARAADGRVRALAVLAERTQATVQAFLEAIPVRLQATVRRVCTDLCARRMPGRYAPRCRRRNSSPTASTSRVCTAMASIPCANRNCAGSGRHSPTPNMPRSRACCGCCAPTAARSIARSASGWRRCSCAPRPCAEPMNCASI